MNSLITILVEEAQHFSKDDYRRIASRFELIGNLANCELPPNSPADRLGIRVAFIRNPETTCLVVVSDNTRDEDLQVLQNFEKLQQVIVMGKGVTKEGLKALKRQHPNRMLVATCH